MSLTAESYGRALILNLKGELTEDTLAAVGQSIEHHLQAQEVVDLVLNMEAVPFVDSKALEYLLELQERLVQEFKQVKLLKCDENVRKILEITRMDGSFELCSDVPEAVKGNQG